MSLPQELLDQLLSGYLDDALTADERVRVEQLLQSDSEVANELDQLRALRRSLQALSRTDSDIRLEEGFADRVLGAAVARAREEGLADDHPLVRLAEQPSTATPSGNHASWRAAAAMLALAASIVIAVFMLRPQSEPDPGLVVQVDPAPIESVDVPEGTEVIEDGTAINPGAMLAESAQPAVEDVATSNAEQAIERSSSNDPIANDPMPVVDPNPTSPVELIASSETPSGTPAVPNLDVPASQLGAILVVDVRRTESGRASGAVAKAMRAADIAPASRKDVTEQIAGFVAGNLNEKGEDASVLYLQLPGKQFDLFYRELWSDEKGIETVRMTIAMDAPFLKVVDAVKPDPTRVQHDAAAFELFSNDAVVNQLAHELSQLPFPDVQRNAGAAVPLGTGPDIQAQVLVLVR